MDSPTPLFTVGQEIATFLVSYGIVSKAWDFLASDPQSFTMKEDEDEGIAYAVFPSFHNVKGFNVKGSKYGEGNIQTDKVFSECLKGNDDKPALVHQGALKMFLHILKDTDFEAKLQIYTDWKQKKVKPIIFVGHSLGGAVATLATLWVLEKRLRKSSLFCITFGCPLVGDVGLVEAVGRENWAGNFCNLVSKYDIVPRMLLAPFESIVKHLSVIFPYWQDIVPYSFIQDTCSTLLDTVLNCLNESDEVIERSPYKPFGVYIFCSTNGATCIDNSDTVLKMLRWTMQNQETSCPEIVQDCFSEHVGYGSVLKDVIKKSISGTRSANLDPESAYEMGISLQLQAIGVGGQVDSAGRALRIAGQTENKRDIDIDKLAIELSLKQRSMAELEWYKESCEKGGIGYYDTFKSQNDMKDVEANRPRVVLAGFWDDIIERWEKHELPSDFESQNKWINAGNTYRRLVEPLDIAYYYGPLKSEGNYLLDGRPKRHIILQKWKEEKDKIRSSRAQKPRTKFASLAEDSCFWAHVEEALKDLANLKQGQQERLESLEEFEDNVISMINYRSIPSDVFLKGSSFMMWWKEWKDYNKNQCPEWTSPLCETIPSDEE